jgi:hypothetical protein
VVLADVQAAREFFSSNLAGELSSANSRQPASPFTVSAPAGISATERRLCLYWPLGTLVITGPKVLDFYSGFCAHRATCLKADGKDITDLKLILNRDSNTENEA